MAIETLIIAATYIIIALIYKYKPVANLKIGDHVTIQKSRLKVSGIVTRNSWGMVEIVPEKGGNPTFLSTKLVEESMVMHHKKKKG